MSQLKQRLDAVQAWLARSHGAILSTALAIEQPAGMSPEWKATLDAFGITPESDEERAGIVRMSTMTRGAPLVEVQRVLEVLARNGEATIDEIDWPDDAAESAQYNRLRTRVVNMVEDSMAAYRAKVMATRSMLAMAQASMKQPAQASQAQGPMTVILICRNCGAPRLTDGQFVCDYCQTPF
jgi:hypothetical protein